MLNRASFDIFEANAAEYGAGAPRWPMPPTERRPVRRPQSASYSFVPPRNEMIVGFPAGLSSPVDGRAFEGHWGPLSPPSVGATTRDEQWTVCRDMIRGCSNGLRVHFTRAIISICRLPHWRHTSRARQSGPGSGRRSGRPFRQGPVRFDGRSSCTTR